jgi:hypothetical protein
MKKIPNIKLGKKDTNALKWGFFESKGGMGENQTVYKEYCCVCNDFLIIYYDVLLNWNDLLLVKLLKVGEPPFSWKYALLFRKVQKEQRFYPGSVAAAH